VFLDFTLATAIENVQYFAELSCYTGVEVTRQTLEGLCYSQASNEENEEGFELHLGVLC
jgi:hypothetical protein